MNEYGGCPKCGSMLVENMGDYEYPDSKTILAMCVNCKKCNCDFTETYELIAQEVIE
jgi:C4-type Zn-finger protein